MRNPLAVAMVKRFARHVDCEAKRNDNFACGRKTVFGKKSSRVPGAFAQRVRKVAETASFVPEDPSVGNREPRAPAFKPGTLTFQGGERIAVVVKNISRSGARVDFVRSDRLPERVMLVEPLQGVNTWAHVTWQTMGVAGLKFAPKK
jgi:hypothetical protein